MCYQNVTVQEVYSTFEKEYKTVTENVGLATLPWKKVILLKGSDAQSFLDRMLSQKIIDLKPGEGCHATLLQKTGYMIADLYVLCFKDYLWLIVDEIVREKTRETLNKFIVADDVTVEDISCDWKILTICGKEARSFLKNKWHFSIEKPYSHCEVAGAIIYKSSHALYPSFDLVIAQKGLFDVGAIEKVGFTALNTLRIEAGCAWYPFEISEKTIPLEINFHDAISYDKGCYTGQETIAKATYRGHVNKISVKIVVEGNSLPEVNSEILLNGQKVGWLTSAVYSPQYGKTLALGFIKYDLREYQETFTVGTSKTLAHIIL